MKWEPTGYTGSCVTHLSALTPGDFHWLAFQDRESLGFLLVNEWDFRRKGKKIQNPKTL
jgi:hypothetical protein